MHSNRSSINKTVEICITLLSHNSSRVSCWLHTWPWELSNSSNKFAANLNMKGQFLFYSSCVKHKHKHKPMSISYGRTKANSKENSFCFVFVNPREKFILYYISYANS